MAEEIKNNLEEGLPPDADFKQHGEPMKMDILAENPKFVSTNNFTPDPIEELKTPEETNIDIIKEAEKKDETAPPAAVDPKDAESKRNAKFAAMRITAAKAETEAATQKKIAEEATIKLQEYEAKIKETETLEEPAEMSDLVGREIARKEAEKANSMATTSQKAIDDVFIQAKNTFFEGVEAIKTKYPDFDSAIQTKGLEHPVISNWIFNSPQAYDLAYYLGKNPEITSNLTQMNQSSIMQELATIGARLEVGKISAKKISGAPDPTNTIKGGGSNHIKTENDMSIDEITNQMKVYDRTHVF